MAPPDHSKPFAVPSRAWLAIPFFAFAIGILAWESARGALVLYHVLLTLPLFLYRSRWSFRDLFRGFAGLPLFFYIALIALAFAAVAPLALAKGFHGAALREHVDRFVVAPPLFSLYFIAINPIFEELFWRGLFARDDRGMVLEDFVFGAFHAVILWPFLPAPYILGCVAFLSGCAWLWRQENRKRKGLSNPWLIHAFLDLMLVSIVVFLIRYP